MKIGMAVLRLVVGLLFVGHGMQKLAGWFGGSGLNATASGFQKMGMHPPKAHAVAAGVAEAGGGALLITGAANPLAGTLLTGVMTTAVEKVHLKNGVWVTKGGFEYNLVLVAALFAVTAEEDGVGWALAQLAAGVAGGLAASRLPTPEQIRSSGRFERAEERVPTGSTAG